MERRITRVTKTSKSRWRIVIRTESVERTTWKGAGDNVYWTDRRTLEEVTRFKKKIVFSKQPAGKIQMPDLRWIADS